ncbi:MAG TPA: histidine kinase [Cyanobacteria bacterium UBA8553]|nr:histidine kinase [Cyanobacteria bacterium UBA8553]HAJ63733.1 histidine kinase [Cyanobacteria bacterium UBA8543]
MLKNLKLAPRFTILLSLVFISSIILTGVILSQAVHHKAKTEVADQGSLIMAMMISVRDYTSTNINPLLKSRLETDPNFIRETVPAFSAITVFQNFIKQPKYKDFYYKEAVINPTNPQDEANDFEKKIVKQFWNQSDLPEVSNFTERSGKQVFYTARPIVIKDKSCLRCHSIPALAPKSQLAKYGSKNGFGWKLNDIVGIQIVYVPSEEVFSIAHRYLSLVMGIFIAIFALVILLINFLLKRTVVQPIRPMARLAQKISNEQFSADNYEEAEIESLEKVAKKTDELGQLARLFQQMAHAIYAREQDFAQQLQQLRNKSEQGQGYTPTSNNRIAYFKALQQKAQTIRNRMKGTN